MPAELQGDERKLAELILYLADRCEEHEYFGLAKLNKLLFMCDFTMYFVTRKAITNSEYVARERGPVPRNLERIRDAMVAAGDVAIKRTGNEHRVVALREPNLALFTSQEIDVVNRAIRDFRPHAWRASSDFSHGFGGCHAAWRQSQATGDLVVIPYESVLLVPPRLDPFEEAHVLELARKYGWASRRSVEA